MLIHLHFSNFFVHDNLSESRTGSRDSGDQIANGLDTLNLLLEETLEEVGGHAVGLAVGEDVEIDDRLVDGLLQLQSRLHRVERTSPLVILRLRDVLQHDASTARVLEFHELLRVFRFLGRGLLEVLGKAGQSDVVPIEVERHRQVNVMGVELHVHLLVDTGLSFEMVVLTDDGSHFDFLLLRNDG